LDCLVACALNTVDQIVVAGGRQSSNSTVANAAQNSLNNADVFHADSKSMSSVIGGMRAAAYGAGSVSLDVSEFVIAGGASGSTAVGFELFDTGTGTFKQTNNLAPTSSNMTLAQNRYLPAVEMVGGMPAVIGGESSPNVPSSALNTIEVYSAQTNTWQALAAHLITPRAGCTATRLANGDVLVMGGVSASGIALNTTEIISGTGTNVTVSQGPLMRVARSGHTTTLLRNGEILVVGGLDQNNTPVSATEIFSLPGQVVIGSGLAGGITPGGVNSPALSSLNPTTGPEGTLVTITGTNFSTNLASNLVRFNGIITPVQSASASSITVLVPNGATTGEVSVQVANVISTNNPVFTVSTTGTGTGTGTGNNGGNQFSGPPRIFIVLPSSGGMFMPVGIGGTNFDSGTIPFINGMPSIALFNWSLTSIPLIGSVSIGFTIVPPGAPSGAGYVQVTYYGQVATSSPSR